MKANDPDLANRLDDARSCWPVVASQGFATRALRLVVLVVALFAGVESVHADWRVIDRPGADGTFPLAVAGDRIVGYFDNATGNTHGFLYDGRTWTDLDYPGAIDTYATGISGRKIVGYYHSDVAAERWHGFVYDGRNWTMLDYPGAVATRAYGIDGHTIVGSYWDGHVDHGFVYDGRTWTTVDYADADATFVNAASQRTLAGNYVVDTYFHGFLRNGARWLSLDAPGAEDTYVQGVSGDLVVGTFFASSSGAHGFAYDRRKATWATLDFPGTEATDLNGTDGESIVGYAMTSDHAWHGVLYTLAPDRDKPSARARGWIVGTQPANGYGVILHTTDGGHQWNRQGSASDVPDAGLFNVKAVDRNTAWVVGNSDGGYGVILRTDDGGATWARRGGPGAIPNVDFKGIGAPDRKSAWVVGSNGTILHTDDEGRTWTQQQSGTTAGLYEVAAIDARTAWVAGDQDGGYAIVLHTADGGRTWVRQGAAATLKASAFIDFSAANPRNAWGVGVDSYVYKTTDAGSSWQVQMGPGLPHNNGVCAVDATTAWIAADYAVVYRTTDGGKNWVREYPEILEGYWLMGTSALDRDTAWVVGQNAPDPDVDRGIIVHTTDGGVTWSVQAPPVDVPFRRVSFVGASK
jgi:probable HAF family extracellular repeat protein